MSKIKSVSAYEIIDSRGNPTIRAKVTLESGIEAEASVPSGASTGSFEAVELRDGGKRFAGKGVKNACLNVNDRIAPLVCGMDPLDQYEIDKVMIDADGTENKSNLGANAILAVSLAVARSAASENGLKLFRYLSDKFQFKKKLSMPTPFFNILNGGKHADSGLSVQEFQIIPKFPASFEGKVEMVCIIFYKLAEIVGQSGFSKGVGDEGGYAPRVADHGQAFDLLARAIDEAGYSFGKDVFLGIDAAASDFFDKDRQCYVLKPENISLNAERLIVLYQEWKSKFSVISIEDGLAEDEWEDWKRMKNKLSVEKMLVIGDDLLATNLQRLEKAVRLDVINTAIVKPNQIGSLSEAVDFIKSCQKNNVSCVISHRSGETADTFIADLAVACGAEYVKFGAPCRGERTEKYNRLLEIERELKNSK